MKDHIPCRAGIGLRAPHYRDMLERMPDVGWLEVHGENYFCAGGQPHRVLQRLRDRYPLSMHCVGLSLGSSGLPAAGHVQRLHELTQCYEPDLVSDHVSWSGFDGTCFNDLLPLPFTEEALTTICRNVTKVQDGLGRRIAVENISAYLRYRHSTIAEPEFIAEIVRRTGCAVLLDVNNIHVNAVNHGIDPIAYLRGIPADAVVELHLAGYEQGGACLVDTHSRPVAEDVWALFDTALEIIGPRPTLIEWDTDIPVLDVLLAEAARAERALQGAVHDAFVA